LLQILNENPEILLVQLIFTNRIIPIHESVTTLSWIGIIFLVDSLDVIDPHEFHV
jgi:hypothetical protein